MNTNRTEDREGTNFGPMMGFAVGAMLGAGIALLMAPCSGEETRQRLGKVANRLGRGAGDGLGQVRDAAGRLGSDAQAALQAGKEAFRANRESAERDGRMTSRIPQEMHTTVSPTSDAP